MTARTAISTCSRIARVAAGPRVVRTIVLLAAACHAARMSGESPPPDAGDTRMVVVEGVGVDVESAKRDAYRAAVRQVVGGLVDSKTVAENDRLITDRVVVFSDGFVERVELMPDGQSRETDGLVRLRLKAFVKTGQVVDRLRANAIGPARAEAAIEDPQSLVARVMTVQERAADARAAFLSVAEGYPANCLQAEAFPLTDSSVRVNGDVVECDVRVKVSVRKAEYEEFAQRLVTFLDTLPPEAQATSSMPDPKPITRRPLASEDQHLEGLMEEVRAVFADLWFADRLVRSFDRRGYGNPLLDFGARTGMWADATFDHEPRDMREVEVAMSKATGALENRTGRLGVRLCVVPQASPPYAAKHYLVDRDKVAWLRDIAPRITCEVAFRRDGENVASQAIQLREFGFKLDGNVRTTEDALKTFERWGQAMFAPGCVQGGFGPTLEFTVPVQVPVAQFTKGLTIGCTITNGRPAAKTP